ncbi:MAG: diaminopimelate epimerase [Balneolaceae bacterium]|nr:diaminopimelate epimerase [Balneolaceae bacterium]
MTRSNIIPFTKIQGTGNDFIIIDNRENLVTIEQIIELAPKMCHRTFGIGADGIILLNNPSDPTLDYTMVYRNADGSNAGMCGNGARCLALFANDLEMGSELTFNVHKNIYKAKIIDKENIQISFPMKTEVTELQIEGQPTLYQSHPGTEHVVLSIEQDLLENEEYLRATGKRLRNAEKFQPPGTNVNFMYGGSADSLKLQTYERGVEDLTLACGTGAIASALTWHHIQGNETLKNNCTVRVKGGELTVEFSYDKHNNKYQNIRLAGPAERVFSGEYHV